MVLPRITRDVSSKYQASENLRVLRVLGPLIVLHFIGYPLYFAISLVVQSLKKMVGELLFRVLYSIVYFPSHYCLLSTLVLWYTIRKSKREREDTSVFQTSKASMQRNEDIYFQNYTAMWR
ncbi:hypothetical protein Q1695_007588 [Nippostrongylus brasiliensis]|nr:hypothetical protein Q1695_007588 [Nippostrongylus brasiliensis]